MTREFLIDAIATFLSTQDAAKVAALRETVATELDAAGEAALAALSERLSRPAESWGYYAPDPLARHLHHVIADILLEPASTLVGTEHLPALADRPVVVLPNHLSYADANLLEILMQRHGARGLADRLTVIAGPKVYSSQKRRFSSLCFGTIRVPQSSGVSSEEAVMDAREIARAARLSIEAAHARLRANDALLVFAEGTRSRSKGMQETLTGVARYLDVPRCAILPVGLTGTEALFPIGDETVHPVPIIARLGTPLDADALRVESGGDRRLMMDVAALAIAGTLPPDYRGVYASPAGLEPAREVLRRVTLRAA